MRTPHAALLSLTHPSRSMFEKQRALLRKAVPAGFPSPADDYVERRLSLDEHLIEHKESTFFMRVAGHSMLGLGIYDGDLLIVDRSIPAAHGCVVVAVIDGEFTVKQLLYTPQGKVLRAAHPDYPDVAIRAGQDFSIWGVVQWNVHKV
ncbi:MAG: peptidase S24 [Gallionellales bacterium GWA2_59_43]|nr:MAG: peptidase S24 [Gallionellales bacterium GWA2_59_43]